MNNQDELERLLGTELHQRVDHMSDAPLGLGDVKGRAGRIRRNRRIAAGVGVAAAVAIIAPVAMLVTPGPDSSTELPIAPEPSPRDVHTTLTLDGLPRGDAPAIEYFTGDGVVLPGRGLQPLDQSYQALIENPAMGGWSAVGPTRGELIDFTADFERTSARTITDAVVTTPDRTRIAFVAPEAGAQTLHVWDTTDPDTGKAWNLPELPVVQPVGFLDDETVVIQSNDDDGQAAISIAGPDGSVRDFEGEFLGAKDASAANGLVTVQTRSNADGSGCFGVVDPAESTTAPAWETCDYSLGAFSPDGQYVMASSPYLSGFLGSLTILDADTGSLVATFLPERRSQILVQQVAWESADTVVAVANEGPEAHLLRLGADGTLEDALPPQEIVGDTPFYLGIDRLGF